MSPLDYADSDTAILISIADRCPSQWVADLHREIMTRLDVIRVGLIYAPREADVELKKFCPQLRVRLALEQMSQVVIEHKSEVGWMKVCFWPFDYPKQIPERDTKGRIVGKYPWSIRQVIELLAAGDIQRRGPKDYLKSKREQSAKVEKSNDRKSDEMLLEAVDKMVDPQNFVRVQRAIQTGDQITFHGDDLKSMEYMDKVGRAVGSVIPTNMRMR